MNEKATAAFIEQTIRTRNVLSEISNRIDGHLGIGPDEVNWGHVNRMTWICSHLEEILTAIDGEEV